jgi:glycosyltransferase involved in cell wall biosynthesis
MNHPQAAVVLTTKNRKEDLRKAITSALSQTGATVEVIVIDDGSTDGTSDLVRGEFPSVRLVRCDVSQGYIVQRNHGARLASAPVIFSIDDDAEFSTPRVVADTLKDFSDDCIGAVAIPFINVNRSPKLRQAAPSTSEPYACAAYIGTAHAVRKDLFLCLDGYREQLVHQCEEIDFCVRMLDQGHVVRLGSADPIFHYESPRRSTKRIVVHNARNHILFSWHNVPFPQMPIQMAGATVNLIRHGIRERAPCWTAQGLARGFWTAMTSEAQERKPVRGQTFKAFRHMYRQPRPLREIRDLLALQA